MLNKRWITLPAVFCRPFASKSGFFDSLPADVLWGAIVTHSFRGGEMNA